MGLAPVVVRLPGGVFLAAAHHYVSLSDPGRLPPLNAKVGIAGPVIASDARGGVFLFPPTTCRAVKMSPGRDPRQWCSPARLAPTSTAPQAMVGIPGPRSWWEAADGVFFHLMRPQPFCDGRNTHEDDEELEDLGKPTIGLDVVNSPKQHCGNDANADDVIDSRHFPSHSRTSLR